MFTVKYFFKTSYFRTAVFTLPVVLLVLLWTPAYAQSATGNEQTAVTEPKPMTSVENLVNIQKSIEQKQQQLRETRNSLTKTRDAAEQLELEKNVTRLKNEITDLQSSFEHVALGGINQSIFNEQPEKQINWQEELEQVIRPLLSTLKELTAKPRQMDTLRRDIERRQGQLKTTDKIIETIHQIQSQTLPPAIVEPVKQLLSGWEQRRTEIQRDLEIAQFKLNSLQTESETWQTSTTQVIKDFLRGRGLTLLIAIGTVLLIWLVSRGLLKLFLRWVYKVRQEASGIARAPLLFYSYRLVTAIIMTFAVLIVFYTRGDVLLLTLMLIALVGVALALRQTLPRYAAEVRLLLGVGPVRENERIIMDGVPFKVTSLSVYTELRNPELDGFLRLPLHAMDSQVSRPVKKEPWFPSRTGDFVILSDGLLARVIRQSVELVEVMVMDSIKQFTTRAYLEQNVRNLTREGFGIGCLFGIDYEHQAICLDTVPDKFKTGITNRFEQSDLKGDIKQLQVEFSQAGASSLDYRIYMVLDGHAASAYYKAQRMVAQACVDVCNREGWIIPFTQITVHSAQDS